MSSSSSCNFDSLLLQSMMGRLQLRPPYLNTNSHLSQSLEDFLVESNPPDYEQEEYDQDHYSYDNGDERTLVSKEESRVEKQIIRVILSGNIETLKPNSGHAVTIGEHHICVGFHQDAPQSDYRVWEWHGHVMLFDEQSGFTPEYIYGNYFERRVPSSPLLPPPALAAKEEDPDVATNLGLRELIDGGTSITAGRILCRNYINAASTRF